MRKNVLICQIHNVPRRTLRMPHLEQELLTIQEYLSSPPIFRDVRVSLYLVFCLVFCRSLFVLLRLNIALSVLLRFAAFDYISGIFNVSLYVLVHPNIKIVFRIHVYFVVNLLRFI